MLRCAGSLAAFSNPEFASAAWLASNADVKLEVQHAGKRWVASADVASHGAQSGNGAVWLRWSGDNSPVLTKFGWSAEMEGVALNQFNLAAALHMERPGIIPTASETTPDQSGQLYIDGILQPELVLEPLGLAHSVDIESESLQHHRKLVSDNDQSELVAAVGTAWEDAILETSDIINGAGLLTGSHARSQYYDLLLQGRNCLETVWADRGLSKDVAIALVAEFEDRHGITGYPIIAGGESNVSASVQAALRTPVPVPALLAKVLTSTLDPRFPNSTFELMGFEAARLRAAGGNNYREAASKMEQQMLLMLTKRFPVLRQHLQAATAVGPAMLRGASSVAQVVGPTNDVSSHLSRTTHPKVEFVSPTRLTIVSHPASQDRRPVGEKCLPAAATASQMAARLKHWPHIVHFTSQVKNEYSYG
eukprot:SAG31_NODE_557_length_14160_cov_18.420880_11_plen_421_part_00